MFARVSTILEVPANEATCELDSENEAALLSKEGITEVFKDVFVILVCCDIVCTDKEVHQIQMNKMLVDWGCSGEQGNKS